MSDTETQTRGGRTLFDRICQLLDTGKSPDETADEFKLRVAKSFNGWAPEDFEDLPESVKMWQIDTSKVVARNLGRQRPRALPGLPGLDTTLVRIDLSRPEPKKPPGRKRHKGEDATTRIMMLLSEMENPAAAKIEELRQAINDRHNIVYSDSALKTNKNAFIVAREILLGPVEQSRAAE
jgi:hypothetical protein